MNYFKNLYPKHPQKGQALILTIVILLVIGSIMMVGGFSKVEHQKPLKKVSGSVVAKDSDPSRKNLQLQTLDFQKRSTGCNHDNGQPTDPTCACTAFLLECEGGKCVRAVAGAMGSASGGEAELVDCEGLPGQADFDSWCSSPALTGGQDGLFCLGKPVIYLYPEKTTQVDVSVETPGKIVVSDPLYPAGGWKNVTAHPDGTLFYNGDEYRELFYESEVSNFLKPTNGIIIATSDLDARLTDILYKLGLEEFESREFREFWIPILEDLNSSYILFSILTTEAKEKIDQVIINPEPDTRIEFIGYFKPLDTPIAIEPLTFGPRPERIGFTAVEWGATIDTGKVGGTSIK